MLTLYNFFQRKYLFTAYGSARRLIRIQDPHCNVCRSISLNTGIMLPLHCLAGPRGAASPDLALLSSSSVCPAPDCCPPPPPACGSAPAPPPPPAHPGTEDISARTLLANTKGQHNFSCMSKSQGWGSMA